MKVSELIAKLQALPQYADIVISRQDEDDETSCEYVGFEIELRENDESNNLALVTLTAM